MCRACEIPPHTQTEGTHVYKMPNVGLLGGVWPSCCEHALLPSDRCLRRFGALGVFTPRDLAAARLKGRLVRRRTRGRRSTSGWRKSRAIGRVAHQVALQVGPTTNPNMHGMAEGDETGQPTQIGVATPRGDQAESQGNAEAPDPTAVSTWTEERMLELATSLPAMRSIRHQPRGQTKDVHFTQKAVATSHTLPSPLGLA